MNAIRPVALVTGASSGIGAEISVELAVRGHDLILTGRDSERLAAVAGRIRSAGGSAETVPLDLGAAGAVELLLNSLGGRPIDVLVNNAGFGLSDPLSELDPEQLDSMIQLNIGVLTRLTRAVVPSMVSRKRGRILNVASTAAFQPCPGMAVYGATKAYVLSFSEAVAEELSGTGVTVTALCPGATSTRFADRAAMTKTLLFQQAMEADRVARNGVAALLKGKMVTIPGFLNSLMVFSVRLSPRKLVAKIAALMLKKPH